MLIKILAHLLFGLFVFWIMHVVLSIHPYDDRDLEDFKKLFMYHQIPQFKIDKVKELLKTEISLQAIARATGLSFFTVRKISCEAKGTPYKKKKEVFDLETTCPITGYQLFTKNKRA